MAHRDSEALICPCTGRTRARSSQRSNAAAAAQRPRARSRGRARASVGSARPPKREGDRAFICQARLAKTRAAYSRYYRPGDSHVFCPPSRHMYWNVWYLVSAAHLIL